LEWLLPVWQQPLLTPLPLLPRVLPTLVLVFVLMPVASLRRLVAVVVGPPPPRTLVPMRVLAGQVSLTWARRAAAEPLAAAAAAAAAAVGRMPLPLPVLLMPALVPALSLLLVLPALLLVLPWARPLAGAGNPCLASNCFCWRLRR
jgi:hypothetical protein